MDLVESGEKVKFKLETIASKLAQENVFLFGARKLKGNDSLKDKILESEGKVACLNKALLKYQGLAVLDQRIIHDRSFRKKTQTFSGRITLKLLSCLDVLRKISANSEIFLVVKVDGTKKAQSSFTRGKWDEEIILDVDKALELEFLILEKNGSVLAMIWFTFRMLIEDIERYFIDKGILSKRLEQTKDSLSSPIGILSRRNDHLECVFELEPAGKIHVNISLG